MKNKSKNEFIVEELAFNLGRQEFKQGVNVFENPFANMINVEYTPDVYLAAMWNLGWRLERAIKGD